MRRSAIIDSKLIFLLSRRRAVFFCVCLLFAFGLYGQTLRGEFVFDDRGIVEHAEILKLTRWSEVVTLPYWEAYAGLYRPVTLLSYAFNYSLFGPEPQSFHLINVLLYGLSGWLLYLLISQLFGRKNLAALTAVLFLLLPIHTEAVANIVGRAEILALLFSLLALLEIAKIPPGNFSPAKIVLYSLLAIGSKETAIALLPIAAMIIMLQRPENRSRLSVFLTRTWQLLSVMIGFAVYFFARAAVLGKYFFSLETSIVENPLMFAQPISRIATASKIAAMYLGKSLWPANLCSDYSYNQIPLLGNFWHWQALLGMGLLLALAALALALFQTRSLAAFGAGFFLLAFLPVSNLFFPIGTIAGERLMYYPSVGLALLLAGGISRLWGKSEANHKGIRAFLLLTLTVLGAAYAVQTHRRSGDWLTEKRLFASAAACAPHSVLSRSNLGAMHYIAGNYQKAEAELLAARQIYDGYTKAENNLGLVYWKTGRRQEAKAQFLRAITLPNGYRGALENLGLMALEEGNVREAREWFLKFYDGDQQKAETAITSRLSPK